MLDNSLQNKKIIISAGASGIGWATTKICVAKGASVYLCDIDLKAIIKVNEDSFLDEFLPQVCLTPATVEVVDKSGNIKGYITDKELFKALTKSKADILTKSKT